MLSFAAPWMFSLLLLPSLLAVYQRLSGRPRTTGTAAIALPPRLQQALTDTGHDVSSSRPSILQSALLWLCWLCLVSALARPAWITDRHILPAGSHDMALVIDLSASMEKKDFFIAGESVGRLSVVRQVLHQFVPARRGDRLSLVLFGKEAFVAAPLGFDTAHILRVMDTSRAGLAGRTTAIGDALGLAIDSLRHDESRDRVIILLSDGTNNAGNVEPESAARLAARLGIRVHTIGLGADTGDVGVTLGTRSATADLDDDSLKQIARHGNGQYFRARNSTELARIYQSIDQLETRRDSAPPVLQRLDIRNPLIVALLVLLLLSATVSRLWYRHR